MSQTQKCVGLMLNINTYLHEELGEHILNGMHTKYKYTS